MPKIVDHDARRLSIARSAWRSIANVGMGTITLREIADDVGCTTGLLTHYYESKEALLTASLQLVVDETLARTDGVEPRTREDLLHLLDLMMPTSEDRALEWRVWIWFWAHSLANPELADRNRLLQQVGTGVLTDALRGLQTAGAIQSNQLDLTSLAVRIYQAVNGLGLDATFDPDGWPVQRQRRHIAEIVDELLSSQGDNS